MKKKSLILQSKLKLKNPKELMDDGFRIITFKESLTGIALFSLRIALEAYSSTYQPMKRSMYFDKVHLNGITQEDFDEQYRNEYFIKSAEAIIHFQHFIELVFKDILREEHELLANDASNNPVAFRRLLFGQSIDDLKLEKLKSIEFASASERLYTLIEKENLGKGKYNFILECKEWISQLNTLRNKLWHRGTFVLRYTSLDIFVCKFILPFVNKVTSLKPYNASIQIWKYKPLFSGIDPISILEEDFKKLKYNIRKVALLKELIRAAYNNPYRKKKDLSNKKISFSIGEEIRKRAELLASSLDKLEDNFNSIHICPVCGVKSLVPINDFDTYYDNGEEIPLSYIYNVECLCCSFDIYYHDFDDIASYGLDIENYWKENHS